MSKSVWLQMSRLALAASENPNVKLSGGRLKSRFRCPPLVVVPRERSATAVFLPLSPQLVIVFLPWSSAVTLWTVLALLKIKVERHHGLEQSWKFELSKSRVCVCAWCVQRGKKSVFMNFNETIFRPASFSFSAERNRSLKYLIGGELRRGKVHAVDLVKEAKNALRQWKFCAKLKRISVAARGESQFSGKWKSRRRRVTAKNEDLKIS